jgi:hypothetical protein
MDGGPPTGPDKEKSPFQETVDWIRPDLHRNRLMNISRGRQGRVA